ncbi:MAG: ACT domain-containing protein [Candidatus Ratteibacteria bacterium]|jgi:hypothetical protein
MKVKQISIFLENKAGRLQDALSVLAREKINIRALAIADTSEFGILRIIVTDPDRAVALLTENHFTVRQTEVIAIGVSDQPGGLSGALDILRKADINVEYLYAFVKQSAEKAVVILRVEDVEAGRKILEANQVTVLSAEEIYAM